LSSEEKSYEDHLRKKWGDFFHREARRLAEIDAISAAILTAVAYENSESGYSAEDHLAALLDLEYHELRESEGKTEP